MQSVHAVAAVVAAYLPAGQSVHAAAPVAAAIAVISARCSQLEWPSSLSLTYRAVALHASVKGPSLAGSVPVKHVVHAELSELVSITCAPTLSWQQSCLL